ncbi:uncharacterized protein DUF4249 [Mongoliibacter ruber]|uniref:Uncharacterized protein DUF4249 n=2 Tax=Mongoliibacter ruber TaxID=1750599 RepID=A0A2T0WST3_9BACT|nr:uncharacterized protein DUF4249 [Mongoliibacter ruber]
MDRKGILKICLLFILMSCREIFEPEIAFVDFGFLVVEGHIEVGGNEVANIRLSRTRSIYDSLPSVPVTQAEVWAESDTGNKYFFVHSANGNYRQEENLPFEQNYRLQIRLNNGLSYASDWMSPYRTPSIENIYFEKEEEGVFVYLDASAGNQSGFLFWTYEEVWQFATPFTSLFKFDTEINDLVIREDPINICFNENNPGRILLADTESMDDGKVNRQEITRIPNESEKLGIRYSIEVIQRSINPDAFEFWEVLRKNTEDVGGIFSPMPSEIPGNIKSLDNPEEPVIGFVGLGSTERKRIYINFTDISPWRARIPDYINCALTDTIEPLQFATFFSTRRFIPLASIETEDPEEGFKIKYLTTTVFCADCRSRGTLEKPEFWEER